MLDKIGWLKKNWLIALTVAWLITGVILLLIYLALYKAVDWQVLTGFATWVLAGGVVFAFLQMRQMRCSTNAQLAVELLKELRSDEIFETLRFIYNLKPEEIEKLKDENDENIGRKIWVVKAKRIA